MFKVYTNSYSLAKSMVTLFPWLYKFTSVPFGFVCVHRSRAQKLLHMCVCVCVYIYIYMCVCVCARLLRMWHGLGITYMA